MEELDAEKGTAAQSRDAGGGVGVGAASAVEATTKMQNAAEAGAHMQMQQM